MAYRSSLGHHFVRRLAFLKTCVVRHGPRATRRELSSLLEFLFGHPDTYHDEIAYDQINDNSCDQNADTAKIVGARSVYVSHSFRTDELTCRQPQHRKSYPASRGTHRYKSPVLHG